MNIAPHFRVRCFHSRFQSLPAYARSPARHSLSRVPTFLQSLLHIFVSIKIALCFAFGFFFSRFLLLFFDDRGHFVCEENKARAAFWGVIEWPSCLDFLHIISWNRVYPNKQSEAENWVCAIIQMRIDHLPVLFVYLQKKWFFDIKQKSLNRCFQCHVIDGHWCWWMKFPCISSGIACAGPNTKWWTFSILHFHFGNDGRWRRECELRTHIYRMSHVSNIRMWNDRWIITRQEFIYRFFVVWEKND